MSTAADGLLELDFAVAPDGKTRVVRREFRFPLRMTAPMYLDPAVRGMAFVYIQNPTGGMFAGDALQSRLALDVGATAHVTTQSATKVYRMETGSASHTLDVTLATGSYLELVPDVLIPQRGSRLRQTMDLVIAPEARMFSMELVAPGRLARGERFEYESIDLRTRVLDPSRAELVVDTLLLEPSRRSADCRGLVGGYSFIGNALAIAPSRNVPALLGAIEGAIGSCRNGVLAGACALPGDVGVAVRALTHTHGALRTVLDAVWRAAREQLLGAPPPRRRK